MPVIVIRYIQAIVGLRLFPSTLNSISYRKLNIIWNSYQWMRTLPWWSRALWIKSLHCSANCSRSCEKWSRAGIKRYSRCCQQQQQQKSQWLENKWFSFRLIYCKWTNWFRLNRNNMCDTEFIQNFALPSHECTCDKDTGRNLAHALSHDLNRLFFWKHLEQTKMDFHRWITFSNSSSVFCSNGWFKSRSSGNLSFKRSNVS